MKSKSGKNSFHRQTIGQYPERLSCVFLLHFQHLSKWNHRLAYHLAHLSSTIKYFLNFFLISQFKRHHCFSDAYAILNLGYIETDKQTRYLNNKREPSCYCIIENNRLIATKEILFLSLVRFNKYFYNLPLTFILIGWSGFHLRLLFRSIQIREIYPSMEKVWSVLIVPILLLSNTMKSFYVIFKQSGNLQKTMSYE